MKSLKQKNVWILLISIILIAAILRFWQLGSIPLSPDWDEAALGYNAYSILHTGRDEYGKFFPIVLQSFGDFKPALYAYLIIPVIPFFDLSVVAVRIPSAMLGVLTVFATFFLVKELTKRNDVSLLSSFLLAISPWHLQFSRVAFEANAALAFNVFGALFFLKGLKKPSYLFLSIFFFAASLYTYQSEKLFVPLFILVLLLVFRKKIIVLPKKYIIAAIIFGIILSTPITLYTFTNKGGLARAKSVSVFSNQNPLLQPTRANLDQDVKQHDILGVFFDNRRVVFAKEVVSNYFVHFNPNWLFISGDIPRHHVPQMGVLYVVELPFLLIGIYCLFFGVYDRKTKIFLFSWFLLAPLPAAVTVGAPHAVRALNFLPTFQIFTAIGLLWFIQRVLRIKYQVLHINIGKIFLAISFFIFLFNFLFYLDQYFVQQNYFNARDWQYGYAQTIAEVQKLYSSHQKIIISNKSPLDQSYIFSLFYLKYSPELYQKETVGTVSSEVKKFGKFEFRAIDWKKESKEKGLLYIGNPQDFPSLINATKTIYYPNGERAVIIIDGKI